MAKIESRNAEDINLESAAQFEATTLSDDSRAEAEAHQDGHGDAGHGDGHYDVPEA